MNKNCRISLETASYYWCQCKYHSLIRYIDSLCCNSVGTPCRILSSMRGRILSLERGGTLSSMRGLTLSLIGGILPSMRGGTLSAEVGHCH